MSEVEHIQSPLKLADIHLFIAQSSKIAKLYQALSMFVIAVLMITTIIHQL
ncbi:hypothetical protein RO3G_13562 [Rhizopus delemar RA 99-880]|uniref:Uncharacterized protein n=1 Tax=Rhizopus delemar (strain RA 99-880 / ATCC MYA-4621 / FGSC 9543 / NRRL 43880) TaxID=246409 RepID=I1CK71_RHIO9|nr:hypothetical protein RO3G_13562 [Rhizopus delemar RA 99-880]|eukprot:EIE88851.1 hypothetical protein RO3G_13562 [Rhizopus delemar RA 99-880]